MGEDHPPASRGLQIGRVVLVAVFLAFGVLSWRNGSWFGVALMAVGVAPAVGALVKGKAMRPQDREAFLWRLNGGAVGIVLALALLGRSRCGTAWARSRRAARAVLSVTGSEPCALVDSGP